MTTLYPSILPMLVGMPLLAAILCCIFRHRELCAALSVVFSILLLIAVAVLVSGFVAAPSVDEVRYSLAGWRAPLGIDLSMSGFSAVMLITTAVLGLVLSIYSTWYFKNSPKSAQFWPVWWLLLAGLNAAFIAADAFNIYVALEMIGLAAVVMVAQGQGRTALIAALRYALVGLLGSLCYLLGVALLYRHYGSLDLAQLATVVVADSLTYFSLVFISVGLLLKTALLPLHFWLPPAHASAPAPVSAVLSALVVKASFFLLVRYWFEILIPASNVVAMNLMGAFGAVAIIWGCYAAFKATRLKLLVAYSTVAQLGYLFLLFPLVGSGGTENLNYTAVVSAVGYFIVAHALAKAAMFLAAGNIMASQGHDRIDDLSGMVRMQPLAVATFAIAGVSLIGLPPSGGFIAKWLMLNVAIQNGQWFWVLVMLVGGLLAALYLGRVLTVAFAQQPAVNHVSAQVHSAPAACIATNSTGAMLHRGVGVTASMSALSLALLAILLGFNAEWILNLLATKPSAYELTGGDLG